MEGRIKIDGQKCLKSHVLKEGELITHELVKTEHKILDRPIEVVYKDQNYLIINKPCSIPMHEGGPFYHNSLSHILKYEMGYENLLSKL